jgi:hypothetical protein
MAVLPPSTTNFESDFLMNAIYITFLVTLGLLRTTPDNVPSPDTPLHVLPYPLQAAGTDPGPVTLCPHHVRSLSELLPHHQYLPNINSPCKGISLVWLANQSCTYSTQTVPSARRLYLHHANCTYSTPTVPTSCKLYLQHADCTYSTLRNKMLYFLR